MVPETGSIALDAFVDITSSYCSKNIDNPWWSIHLHFGQRPSETGVEHRICPPAGTRRGRYRAAYSVQSLITEAQPEDPSDSGTGHKYWTVAGPKYGELACSHGNFLQAALHVALCLQPIFHSLHIAGPSQCP